MGGDSDTSFKIAAGIFGVVVVGLLALGVAKVAMGDTFDDALPNFGSHANEYEECLDAWPPISTSEDHPLAVSSWYDTHGEYAEDATWRSWTVNVQVFRDAGVATRLLDDQRAAIANEDFEHCMTLGGYTEFIPSAVNASDVAGWASVSDYGESDERTENITWAQGRLLVTLEVYGPDSAETEEIVREEYEKARASVREQATR